MKFIKINFFQIMIIILFSVVVGVYAWSEYNRSNEAKLWIKIEEKRIDESIKAQEEKNISVPAESESDNFSEQNNDVAIQEEDNELSVVENKNTIVSSPEIDTFSDSEVEEVSNPSLEQVQVDPVIKIEKCKAEAKYFADQKAKDMYLAAMVKAQESGDSETAQFYFNASIKPEHPHDYDSNYQLAYTSCLDN